MSSRTAHLSRSANAVLDALAALARRDGSPGTAEALQDGHKAVRAIDEALRSLYSARQLLVGELTAEQRETDARVDALIARRRGGQA